MLKEGTADLSAYGEVIAADDEKVTPARLAGRRAGGHDAPAARPAGRRPDDRGPADRGRHRARLRRTRRRRPPPRRGGRRMSLRAPMTSLAPATPPPPPVAAVGRAPRAGRLLPGLDAARHRRPVPVPRRELLLHDRDGRRAGHLPRRLVDDRRAAGRRGRRLHARPVRRLLHRLDARPEHEHHLHARTAGSSGSARASCPGCSSGRSTRSTSTSATSPAGSSS